MADPNRRTVIRELRKTLGVNRQTARYMYDQYIWPTLVARQNPGIGTMQVSTAGTDGYEVTCSGCGRTGRTAEPIPADQAATCPDCLRRVVNG
jgi:hypothetical protein